MIPKLKIIPLDSIIPVMDFCDKRVQYLKEVIESSGTIGNPVSVSDLPGKGFLLLDDSAILEAARHLNIQYLPAQVINRAQILNIRGEVLLDHFEPGMIDEFILIFPRSASVCSGKKDMGKLDNRTVLVFSHKNEKDILACFRRNGSSNLPRSIFDFFDFLGRRCLLTKRIFSRKIRTANTRGNRDFWSLRLLGLTSEQIIAAADLQNFFPAGFIRVDYKSRIIGVEYPVSILNEKASLREKERFLYDLVNFRLNNDLTEYIEGGVYLLNYLAKK